MWMKRCVVLLLLSGALPVQAAEWEGVVQWSHPLTLGTTLRGTVEKLVARPGEHLRKGQELLRLEQAVPRARLEQCKGGVAHTTLRLAEAEKELQRSEELYERTLLSDHDLDIARIAHAEAKSLHLKALADLAEAEQQLRDTVVRAPFPAVVLARHVEEGQSVNGQMQVQPLFTVAHSERLAVRFKASAVVQPGGAVTVTVAGKSHSGHIDSVSREAPGEESVVEVLLPAQPGIEPGMRAVVTLQ